ncbi:MAG: sensor histidine kinase [Acidobacteriia bacterium]|nr:sensor histidine kinase [Terriglobia bacterium]
MRLLPKSKDLGWVPYMWLIYLCGMPATLVLSKASPLQWALNLAGILVFLALYFRAHWVEGRSLMWIIAAMTLLGVAFVPINPGGVSYFIYAGSFAGRAGAPRVGVRILAALVVVIAIETRVFHLTPYFWFPAVLFTLMIGAVGIHFAERHRDNQKLTRAQEEVERMAKVAERERIARDLHDVLGHTLSLIILKSQLAARLSEKDPQRAAREIQDVERISRDALAQVRSTIQGYHSRSLAAEAEQAKNALHAVGVQVECDIGTTGLPAAQEGVLALALREAVTNVIRHASATTCRLSLQQTNGSWRLQIKDDGCGTPAPEGMGLTGMRQRVEALGGNLQREVAGGTTLTIILPAVTQ